MKLMGHRGARDQGPENTLKAFAAAIETGLKVVELDVHQSSDGVLMVHHDETLERTTNGKGLLRSFSSLELQKLDAGEGERIPTLLEALDLLLSRGVEVQVELKAPGLASHLSKALNEFSQSLDFVTVISFQHQWLKDVKEMNPKLRTAGLLFGAPVAIKELYQHARLSGLSFSVNWIDADLVQQVKALGGSVTAWNANTQEIYFKMKNLGVDYLGTDVPLQAIQWDRDL